jgi:N-methylhydantoinase A
VTRSSAASSRESAASKTPAGSRVRIASDVGGTFTDLVYLDEESLYVGLAKASTTPPDFDRGVLDTLKKAELTEGGNVWSFVHGTTVIINAITERTGSPTALITTRGFRDVLEIGRSNRPDLFNLRFKKPPPFVERYLRYEVTERMNHKGEVVTPLNEPDVIAVAEETKRNGAEAIAICFLHSYANPQHEVRCAELVREIYPEASVTMSHEVTMEWREYERTSTAVLNAYVQGPAAKYINRLERELNDLSVRDRLFIMQSNGGAMSFRRAEKTPITMIESGPVAGVIGAAVVGELIGSNNIITLDIGGTTAKTSLIEGGDLRLSTEYKIEWRPDYPGYPVKVPVVDIVEIGAGGGSIAWFDEAGKLRVGPRSAGAVPGPASYPNGGSEPTVTDANLVAGRIDPEYFLGGEIEVSVERARVALTKVAEPLGVDVEEAALGVVRMANANMVNAIKLVSVRRGYDPRDFDMVAFGGGGSMHAAALASLMKIRRVIVPPAPAHFSAWGMLMTDLRADWVRTRVLRSDQVEVGILNGMWEELEQAALDYFEAEGIERSRLHFVRSADLRYKGQEHTVRVPITSAELASDDLSLIDRRFHELHEQQYTFRLDVAIEFVNFHLTAFGAVDKPTLPRLPASDADADGARKGTRLVDFDDLGRHEAAIYERSALGSGAQLEGPAVIEDPAASTVLFPSQELIVDEWGNLILEGETA